VNRNGRILHSLSQAVILPVALFLMLFLADIFITTASAESEPLLVRVGAYENPPKILKDEDGEISGFWPDLIESIAQKENWKIKYIWGTWSEGLKRLKNREIDIMPDVAFTEERNRLYNFSKDPIITSWTRVYVNKENTDIKSVIDLKNKKIAALKGSVNLEGIGGLREISRAFHLNCRFLELDSYTEVFRAVEGKRADAGITNRDFGNKNAKNFKVRPTHIIFQPIDVKFAFPKDGKLTPYLVKEINNRIRELKQDENSSYYKLLAKYFEAKIAEKTVLIFPVWLKNLLQITGVLLISFLLLIIISRVQIRKKTHEIRAKNKELRTTSQLLSAHLLNTPLGAISWDLNYRIIEWNPAAETIFGWTKEEAIGKAANELIVPQDQKELFNGIFRDLLSGKGGTHSINENITKEGRRIVCDWYNTALKDENGNIKGIASLVSNITAQKETEQALKKSEERLMRVFQASPLGIGLVQNRKLLWHNETMSRMLGYQPDELHGKSARLLYRTDEEYELAGRAIKALGAENRRTELKTKWVRKDGSVFDCHIRYTLLNPESKDGVVLALAEDITNEKRAEEEKKRLEAKLNQAQKMEAIGVLAGGVAHDFNNLLTSILGNAELAMQDLDKDASLYKNISEIEKAGQRASSLTRQLLAFSRKELIRPVILDLNKTTEDLTRMLRRLIGEDIELVVTYSPEPCLLKADPGQIEQVLMNLSVNAKDAMPRGGKLIIETENVELDREYFQEHGEESIPGHYVMLSVTDTGIGMDKETQTRIFEPFFTTKEMGRGTGLGLSTVYGIIKQNNGYIWVYSEEGKGTTFKIYFPRVKEDTRDLQKDQSSEPSLTGSETILVVEDEEMLRGMTERILTKYGYKVLTAGNGKEAFRNSVNNRGRIDLILTDVIMPGMSGKELAERMQLKIPEIKVLYMSGYTNNTIADHGILEKDVAFIQKPFTPKDLAGKIRALLDKK